jgi:hypothetical protein
MFMFKQMSSILVAVGNTVFKTESIFVNVIWKKCLLNCDSSKIVENI